MGPTTREEAGGDSMESLSHTCKGFIFTVRDLCMQQASTRMGPALQTHVPHLSPINVINEVKSLLELAEIASPTARSLCRV